MFEFMIMAVVIAFAVLLVLALLAPLIELFAITGEKVANTLSYQSPTTFTTGKQPRKKNKKYSRDDIIVRVMNLIIFSCMIYILHYRLEIEGSIAFLLSVITALIADYYWLVLRPKLRKRYKK